MNTENLLNSNYCYVIAEAGLNHNGDFELAKKLIQIASDAKVDAVKFQKRTVDNLAIKSVLDNEDLRFPEFGKTYREIREFHEFDFNQYVELKKIAESLNLDFIVTPFDEDAVDFLCNLGIEKFKLASHSLTNLNLLKYIVSKNKEIIFSIGMSEIEDIKNATNILRKNTKQVSILHCVSSYPTNLEDSNLNFIKYLQNTYPNFITGYSGHELGIFPSLIACAMGANIIERHFTVDKNLVGFDHKISLEPNELNELVDKIREIQKIKGDGNKKISEKEKITKEKYHVSAVSNIKITKGEILIEEMIKYKNPGIGIPPKDIAKIIGKKLINDIEEDTILTFEMFDNEK